MAMKLKCHRRYDLGGRHGLSRQIDVVDDNGNPVSAYDLMCASIDSDIQNSKGSGAATVHAIERVASLCSMVEELGGNAWYTHITHERVWFEGQYNQGEGGEVTLAQYKLAVETYIKFLADPACKPIEVAFPSK